MAGVAERRPGCFASCIWSSFIFFLSPSTLSSNSRIACKDGADPPERWENRRRLHETVCFSHKKNFYYQLQHIYSAARHVEAISLVALREPHRETRFFLYLPLVYEIVAMPVKCARASMDGMATYTTTRLRAARTKNTISPCSHLRTSMGC